MDPIGTPRRPAAIDPATASPGSLAMINDAGDVSVATYRARYENLKHLDTAKDALLDEVITRYENLMSAHQYFINALAPGSSLSLAQQLRERDMIYEKQYATWNHVLARDPFVVVLIDGQGMIFEPDFLHQGEEGGKQAAQALTRAVRHWAAKALDEPMVHVSIRVYANVAAVSNLLHRAGVIASPAVFGGFVQGFTRGESLCDFVDTGSVRNAASAKLTSHLRLSLSDVHCKQIFLGCYNDNLLAQDLRPLLCDEEHQDRMTLIEGVPCVEDLAALPIRKARFPGLFRAAKLAVPSGLDATLGSRPGSRNALGSKPSSSIFTPGAATPLKPVAASAGTNESSSARAVSTGSTDGSDVLHGTPAPGDPSPWSQIAKKAAKLPFTDRTHLTSTPAGKPSGAVIRINKQGFRLDPPMDYDHNKVFQLKQIKLCNQHYIGKGCCHWKKGNDNCPHIHDRTLSKEELKWLRCVSRETVCKRGIFCRDLDCIYGHQCPYPKATEGSLRGIGCVNGAMCRFSTNMHGMDTAVHRVIPAGSQELEH